MGQRQPTSLPFWPSPTLLSRKGAPDVHGPVHMFMPGGGGRRCAAASHTSAVAPILDRASDVAHCAQNFDDQNAKLTISLSKAGQLRSEKSRFAVSSPCPAAARLRQSPEWICTLYWVCILQGFTDYSGSKPHPFFPLDMCFGREHAPSPPSVPHR